MDNTGIILTVVVVAIIMLVIWVLLLRSARRVNLTRRPGDQKPEWLQTTPHPETLAATQADGEGVTLYDYDKGENVAAAFAEQIEDILQHQLNIDPKLRTTKVDLGTGADGGLVITVGDKSYTSIEQIPDEGLRAAIRHAIAVYNQRGK